MMNVSTVFGQNEKKMDSSEDSGITNDVSAESINKNTGSSPGLVTSSEIKEKLNDYFYEIATNKGIDIVNERINEVLTYFVSPNTPVLISLGVDDEGNKIYYEPQTIKDFCNYLRIKNDFKKRIRKLSVNNSDGKIRKMVLTY
jgi:hypothetical protein